MRARNFYLMLESAFARFSDAFATCFLARSTTSFISDFFMMRPGGRPSRRFLAGGPSISRSSPDIRLGVSARCRDAARRVSGHTSDDTRRFGAPHFTGRPRCRLTASGRSRTPTRPAPALACSALIGFDFPISPLLCRFRHLAEVRLLHADKAISPLMAMPARLNGAGGRADGYAAFPFSPGCPAISARLRLSGAYSSLICYGLAEPDAKCRRFSLRFDAAAIFRAVERFAISAWRRGDCRMAICRRRRTGLRWWRCFYAPISIALRGDIPRR